MKTSNFIFNIVIVAALVYIILKITNKRLHFMPSRVANAPVSDPVSFNTEKALNWSLPLELGYTGNEVKALQLMLQYYNPSQHVTGHMDADTYSHMRTVTAGVYEGGVTLTGFVNSFFITWFPRESYDEIFNQFPKS